MTAAHDCSRQERAAPRWQRVCCWMASMPSMSEPVQCWVVHRALQLYTGPNTRIQSYFAAPQHRTNRASRHSRYTSTAPLGVEQGYHIRQHRYRRSISTRSSSQRQLLCWHAFASIGLTCSQRRSRRSVLIRMQFPRIPLCAAKFFTARFF